MTVEDVSAAIDLWRSCEGVGLSDGDTPAGITTFLLRNPGMSWAAFSGDLLVGAVLAGHDGRRGFLYHLAVHPEFRGRGLGRNLVNLALASVREAGILRFHIMVFRDNERGHEFWNHLGWRRRGDLDVHTLVAMEAIEKKQNSC